MEPMDHATRVQGRIAKVLAFDKHDRSGMPLCVECQLPTLGVAHGYPLCGRCMEQIQCARMACAQCGDTGVRWAAGGLVLCQCLHAIRDWQRLPWKPTEAEVSRG